MLQRQFRAFDLAFVSVATQLLGQLITLGQAGGAQWVALAQQATRGVGDGAPAVGVVTVQHKLLGPALGAQAQRFIAQQLVVGEAVVQLNHGDLTRVNAGLRVDRTRRTLGHVAAHKAFHGGRVERFLGVGDHGLRQDGDVGAQAVAPGKRW